jgi:hypothetical protein
LVYLPDVETGIAQADGDGNGEYGGGLVPKFLQDRGDFLPEQVFPVFRDIENNGCLPLAVWGAPDKDGSFAEGLGGVEEEVMVVSPEFRIVPVTVIPVIVQGGYRHNKDRVGKDLSQEFEIL